MRIDYSKNLLFFDYYRNYCQQIYCQNYCQQIQFFNYFTQRRRYTKKISIISKRCSIFKICYIIKTIVSNVRYQNFFSKISN